MNNHPFRARLPDFLKQEIPSGPKFASVQGAIKRYRLKTVCEEAKCPNRTHCYGRGTLTFQILGDLCTRSCGFCAEKFGEIGQSIDPEEAEKIVQTAKMLSLSHVVITSPARDDLQDAGAGQFARVVQKFREDLPPVTIEILTSDFGGNSQLLDIVFQSRPHIFNHNVETVRRLTPKVRSKATYDRSLGVLEASHQAGLLTKSGLMVGHGETKEEIMETCQDLARAGVQMVTIGQYLPPSAHHLPLMRVYRPAEFDDLREESLQFGFRDVFAGPLVRSSYHAAEMLEEVRSVECGVRSP